MLRWRDGAEQRTLDVQYFIWSTDNVGILAAEALLRAAQRGVRVRVIVDDLLIDGKAAITGGRNIADEYFDYDHEYNFRDRDVLLVGAVIGSVAKDDPDSHASLGKRSKVRLWQLLPLKPLL